MELIMASDRDDSSTSSDSDIEEIILMAEYLNAGRPVRPRQIRFRPDYFQMFDEVDFVTRFRLSKDTVRFLYSKICHEIEPNSLRNHAVPGMSRLLLALRFYATGCFHIVSADFGGVSKTSSADFIALVTRAIARLRPHFVKFPATREELAAAKTEFFKFASFPNVIGALDCTHVRILSPGKAAEDFRNRKGFFSLNVQAICDANMRITDAVARWPGSVHDQRIFNCSRIRAKLESGAYENSIIVGDSGYENRPYLVTPLLQTSNEAERLFNESQIRTRVVIERTFGVLKARFPVLAVGMRCSLKLCMAIIHAVIVLHNLAIEFKTPLPLPDVDFDEVEGMIDVAPLSLGNDRTRRGLIENYFKSLLP